MMEGNVFPMSRDLAHLGQITLEHPQKIRFQEDVPYIPWNHCVIGVVKISSQGSGLRSQLSRLKLGNRGMRNPPFLPDNRRGFARVTPVALSKVGVPDTEIHAMDEFPLHGLGLYDDFEPWGRYSGYVWSDWTTSLCMLTQHFRR